MTAKLGAVRGEGITMMKSVCVALTLSLVGVSSAFANPAPTKAAERATRIEISVTEKGFEPEQIKVAANKPVTLVFRRTTDKPCAKKVVIKISDTQKIEKDLPLNNTVEVSTTFPKAGQLSYTCSMDMIRGTLTVL
ncbi:MAG: cupredoxin domain-containing protein [Kofleriaceae bacterium]